MQVTSKIKDAAKSIMSPCVYERASMIKWNIVALASRLTHKGHIRNIRRKVNRGEKIRVLFIDSEVAKWKTQSLFAMMKADRHYSPVVGISRRDADADKPADSVRAGMKKARMFFEQMGNECVEIYDPDTQSGIDLRQFSPDIVFYQQSWYEVNRHKVWQVYKLALVCHVPYFTPNYGFPDIEAHRFFHRFLAFYFLLNDRWVEFYRKGVPPWFYSGKMIGCGQPMFDRLSLANKSATTKTIIYAPHFSVTGGNNILQLSTFLENGREILEYAKKHREFNWIFKPHPVLYTALVGKNIWTKQMTDEYYGEWNKLGKICTTSDYMDLFSSADIMITDCGSFLPEFGATGKPLIHLIPSRSHYIPAPPSAELFSTFYEVRSLDEMYECFRIVIEQGQDPKKEVRLNAVKKANLTGQNAAKNIMDFFAKEFGIKD